METWFLDIYWLHGWIHDISLRMSMTPSHISGWLLSSYHVILGYRSNIEQWITLINPWKSVTPISVYFCELRQYLLEGHFYWPIWLRPPLLFLRRTMRIRPQQKRIQLLGLNFLGRNPGVEDPRLLSAQCRGEERRQLKYSQWWSRKSERGKEESNTRRRYKSQ